jgi:hypothetical protein
MTPMRRRAAWLVLIGAALVIMVAAGLWSGTVLFPKEPLLTPLAPRFPWPVVCSLRGCITTTAWQQHWVARRAFAEAAGETPPAPLEALTTLARQHLVRHSFLRVPVEQQDAVRYREEVLGLRDEAAVREATGLTLNEYDTAVLLPLLQQEAVRQERTIESLDELFATLARERLLVALPWHLKWNREAARVEVR